MLLDNLGLRGVWEKQQLYIFGFGSCLKYDNSCSIEDSIITQHSKYIYREYIPGCILEISHW